MKLREIGIKNFRSLVDVYFPISDTTVLVGENNSGKTALLDALKAALPSNVAWRMKTFDEYDYHMDKDSDSPQTSEGIIINLWFREDESGEWPDSLVQSLHYIIQTDPIMDLDSIGLRLSSKYDEATKEIIPKWEFLTLDGQSLVGDGAHPSNLNTFLNYVRFFYLSALRNSADEFSPHSQFWGRILSNLKISEEQKITLNEELAKINEDLIKADPMLEKIRVSLEKVQKIMALGTEQNTSIQALPLKTWDLMSRSQVVIKAPGTETDFPLSRHGQGMQSLAVIFLFQAYLDVLLKPTFKPETEAISALEEPEAHLHPQAIRALTLNFGEIKSQKIISTHSPYLIQEIPFTQIRLFRRNGSSSKVLYIKRFFSANVPEEKKLIDFCNSNSKFQYHIRNSILSIKGKMDDKEYRNLISIYSDRKDVYSELKRLRNESQLYLTVDDIKDLDTYAKRMHGDVLFARAWLLCEGQCDYLLIRYFAELLEKPLDQEGVNVIDFQNNGSPGAFVKLAHTFEIPCIMICDNDSGGKGFVKAVKNCGLTNEELDDLVRLLDNGCDCELFLVKNGFIQEYLQILKEHNVMLKKKEGDEGFEDEIASNIRKRKIEYTYALIEKLKATNADRSRVPHLFERVINDIIKKACTG